MAVHVRLRKLGKNPKGKIHFRIAAFDETRSRDGRILEELGCYTPASGAATLKIERIKHWVKNGAQLSPTVKSLLKKQEKK